MSGGMWPDAAGGPPRHGEVLPAGRDPRRRRRRRQAWTFTTLVSLVLVVGLVALGHSMRWWTIGGGEVRSVRPPCPAETAEAPQFVNVRVYNATTRFGLARTVARELQARGFKVTTITNDQSGRPVPGVGIVRHGPPGKLSARSVVAQVAGTVTVEDDGRQTGTVDLVLGTGYRTMIPRPQASQAIAPVAKPVGCRRVTASEATPTATPASPPAPTQVSTPSAAPAATQPASPASPPATP